MGWVKRMGKQGIMVKRRRRGWTHSRNDETDDASNERETRHALGPVAL